MQEDLAVADLDGDGEIAIQDGSPNELDRLFGAMSGGRGTLDTEGAGGGRFRLVTALMHQKRGEDPPLGDGSLRDVDALGPIFDGRPGAKLVKVSGKTVGTGSIQDALNEIAAHGGGRQSPFFVDTGGGRYRSYFGPKTGAAVAAFRRSVGLSNEALVDQKMLEHLDAALTAARDGGDERLSSLRFTRLPIFQQILTGRAKLARGDEGDAVDVLQLSLYSLGYDIGRAWVDADFGGSTEGALEQFQADHDLPRTKVLDSRTLEKLDEASAELTASLKAREKPPGSKHPHFSLCVDKVKGRTQRIYVLDQEGQPVASYKTSPGTDRHPTPNSLRRITHTHVMKPWIPPNSDWARNAHAIPGGPRNPMGVLKLRIDGSSILFHGIPKSEVPFLGRQASHGCMRMSPTNIIHLFENYAEAGTKVAVNVSTGASDALAEKARARGVVDEEIEAGREYIAGYVGRELGRDEVFAGGRTRIA